MSCAVGAALWSHYNWGWHGGWAGGGPVTINVVNYNRFNRTNLVAGQNHWQFDAVHRGSAGFQNAALRQQFGTPRNFQERSFQGTRGTLQGNLQGTQQGTQGQFHIQGNQGNALQGNQGKNFQGKTLQGNQGNALQGNQGKTPLRLRLGRWRQGRRRCRRGMCPLGCSSRDRS